MKFLGENEFFTDGVVKPLENSLSAKVHCGGLKYMPYWKYLGKVDRRLNLHLISQGVREYSPGCSLSKLRRKWTVWDPQASGTRTGKASQGLKATWEILWPKRQVECGPSRKLRIASWDRICLDKFLFGGHRAPIHGRDLAQRRMQTSSKYLNE